MLWALDTQNFTNTEQVNPLHTLKRERGEGEGEGMGKRRGRDMERERNFSCHKNPLVKTLVSKICYYNKEVRVM